MAAIAYRTGHRPLAARRRRIVLIAIVLAMVAAVVVAAAARPARADHVVTEIDYSTPPRYGMEGNSDER